MTAPLTPRERVEAAKRRGRIFCDGWYSEPIEYVFADDAMELAAELEEANRRADTAEMIAQCSTALRIGNKVDELERQLARYREKYGELE